MNHDKRPERVLDPHRATNPASGMRYASGDHGLLFVNTDDTQTVTFRKGDRRVSIRATPSLNHIISEADTDDADTQHMLRRRIDQYPAMERAAINIQNMGGHYEPGVIRALRDNTTSLQLPWEQHYQHSQEAETALKEHKTKAPHRCKTHNESTQTKTRRRITKRCYAVSLLYNGAKHVVSDMRDRLASDVQVLSVHYDNEDGIELLDDTNHDRSLRDSAGNASGELTRLEEELDIAQHSLEACGDRLAETLPGYARNTVKDTYHEANTAFS